MPSSYHGRQLWFWWTLTSLTARCLRSAILAPLASEPGSMAPATLRRPIPTRRCAASTAACGGPARSLRDRNVINVSWLLEADRSGNV